MNDWEKDLIKSELLNTGVPLTIPWMLQNRVHIVIPSRIPHLLTEIIEDVVSVITLTAQNVRFSTLMSTDSEPITWRDSEFPLSRMLKTDAT